MYALISWLATKVRLIIRRTKTSFVTVEVFLCFMALLIIWLSIIRLNLINVKLKSEPRIRLVVQLSFLNVMHF